MLHVCVVLGIHSNGGLHGGVCPLVALSSCGCHDPCCRDLVLFQRWDTQHGRMTDMTPARLRRPAPYIGAARLTSSLRGS